MAQPQDLMDLGMSSYLALREATTVKYGVQASGTSLATCTTLVPPIQTVMVVTTQATSTTAATPGVVMPVVGGASGCLLGDTYIIHNGMAANTGITVYMPTGCQVNITGANTVSFVIAQYKTADLTPVQILGTSSSNTALWIGTLA